MKTLLLTFLAAGLAFHAVAADTIPSELIGEWASPNTTFKGEILSNGSAVFLGSDGFAAIVARDETDVLGMAGTAAYDPKKFILTLNLHDDSTVRIQVTIVYDPKAKILTGKNWGTSAYTGTFKRRQEKIPKWVIDESK